MDGMKNNWHLSDSLVSDLKEILAKRQASSIWVLCDRNTRRFCLPLLKDALPSNTNFLFLPAGESAKTLESCMKIWDALSRKAADRNALVICLGGGMVCDLGAFAASVYKRGIDYLLIPTSLLCMADACLGGKTGIDYLGFKNQLGTFSRPLEILIDTNFLETLPDEELLSGMAEIMKHALCGNQEIWQQLRKSEVHRQNWPILIEAGLRFKQGIVERDPLEKAERKILNAGHTIGHALESFLLASGNPRPHGYCVAAGLVAEGRIAVDFGLLDESELLQIEEFVYAEFGLLPFCKKDIPRILKYCQQDKKNRDHKILASFYGPIGHCTVDHQISEEQIRRALQYYLGA